MVFDSCQLHQAIGTVLLVQVEHPEDQPESGEDTEADTEPPVNTNHIEDDEQQEDGKQAACKDSLNSSNKGLMKLIMCKALSEDISPSIQDISISELILDIISLENGFIIYNYLY